MKNKNILLVLAIVFSSLVNAQVNSGNTYKQGEIMKIPLMEKFNLPARKIPEILLKAYCEGLIQAYYPMNVDSACSYHDFMKQFAYGKTQPKPSADEFSNIQCPSGFCDNPNDPVLEQFKHYFEIIQQKRFDKAMSKEVYDITYVRLVFVREKGDLIWDVPGPVFKYEDVAALTREDQKLTNVKNQAAPISLKQYFLGRMFHGYLTKTSLLKSNNPDQKQNKEKNMWQE
ncbi:MAG TPA: hypothetical protein VGF30_05040 [Bacteroidia bacterium]